MRSEVASHSESPSSSPLELRLKRNKNCNFKASVRVPRPYEVPRLVSKLHSWYETVFEKDNERSHHEEQPADEAVMLHLLSKDATA